MRSRVMIVGRDVALRARLARLLNGGGYDVEIAENPQHARRVGLASVSLALLVPERLDPEAKVWEQQLQDAVGRVLLVGTPEGERRLHSSEVLDVSDEAELLLRVAEATAPAPDADDVDPVLRFASYRFDLAGHSLLDPAGREIPLTSGEFRLLRAFVERPGRVLSRDQLLQLIAKRDSEAFDRSIDMQIVRLRRKIELDAARPELIVTIPGSGYKFAAKVTEEATEPSGEAQGEASALLLAPALERRQLTIMQCAISGPAFWTAARDPEDLHRLLTAFYERCATIIADAGGAVVKPVNDGVLAYFGYPNADEHQAESAVRAARRLIGASNRVEAGDDSGVQARIAIATGDVIVGGLLGDSREQVALGKPAILAAGLVAHAAPGAILVSATTRRLVGELFQCAEREPIMLPEFSEAIAVWRIVGDGAAENRFEALHGERAAPLVGREEELSLLLRRWEQAKAGEGQVVQLSGEAGIGKSRVLAALAERIGDEPHARVRYQCSPHHVNDAFFPITSHIRRAAGFVGGEPTGARLDKLESMIASAGLKAKDIAPLLASLLSISFEGRYPALDLSPGEQKERTISALVALFEGLTKGAPVLVALEDAHWIDPTSLDVFGRMVDRLPDLRALLVVTFRPEFASPWAGRANVASLPLSRFGKRHILALVDGVTRDKALPREVLEQIVAKTDGVPLFVEELTKAILESGLLREEDGAYVLVSAQIPIAVPSTLQDSLMSRLDRLAPVKEIAQIAAAIGREFSYRLLEAVAPLEAAALQSALGQLKAAELIHGRGSPPEATYVFKHALVQDTAYASIPQSRRQRIHADIAGAMEKVFPDQAEAAPAVIAHHFSEGDLAEPAARYWLKAGELALSRSAAAEAERYLDAGLALIPRLADSPDRRNLELALRVARANAFLPLKGFAAPETIAVLSQAKQLLDAGVGSDAQRYSVLHGLCAANYMAAQFGASSLELARQFVEVADRQGDPIYRSSSYRGLGLIQVYSGYHREAIKSLEQAELNLRSGEPGVPSYRFGIDFDLGARVVKVQPLMCLGLHNQAAREIERILSELPNQDHAGTVAACTFGALVCPELLFGDFGTCERHCEALIAFCVEKNVEQFRLMGIVAQACARALRNPSVGNAAALRAVIDAAQQVGARLLRSLSLANLVDALLRAGDVGASETALQQALDFVDQSGERFWLADLHRLEGEIALHQLEPDPERAEACLLRGVEVAREQESRMLELRAANSLARLWRDNGSPNDPGTLLEPILASIEGGETTRDVRNARALLAKRAPPVTTLENARGGVSHVQ
jgi:class 3 adenylate cyclase/tetratricopeptide (TPR) repeat protein